MPPLPLRRYHNRRRASLLEPLEARLLCRNSPCGPTLNITGSAGDDHIVISFVSDPGEATLSGVPGFEDGTLIPRVCLISINAADGNDYVEVQQGNTITAANGLPNLYTTLLGGGGNDVLISPGGQVTLDGGAGNDRLVGQSIPLQASQVALKFADATAGVIIRGDQGLVLDDGLGGVDQISGIAEIYGTPWSDQIYGGPKTSFISGDQGNDLLVGDATFLMGGWGDDTLVGGDGLNTLSPGPGNDRVFGGGGEDILAYDFHEGTSSGVVVRLNRGRVDNDGFGGVDLIQDIEDVGVNNPWYGDILIGDNHDNRLYADDWDLVKGRGGNDLLFGGRNATLLGGSGDDEINLNYGPGLVDGGPGADTINLWGDWSGGIVVRKDKKDLFTDNRTNVPQAASAGLLR